MDKIKVKEAELVNAAINGLTWTVIPRWILTKFGKLPKIIQEAFNTKASAASGEGHVQMLRKLHNAYSTEAKNGAVDFSKIKEQVCIWFT